MLELEPELLVWFGLFGCELGSRTELGHLYSEYLSIPI
jgi:hypothetical protein